MLGLPAMAAASVLWKLTVWVAAEMLPNTCGITLFKLNTPMPSVLSSHWVKLLGVVASGVGLATKVTATTTWHPVVCEVTRMYTVWLALFTELYALGLVIWLAEAPKSASSKVSK